MNDDSLYGEQRQTHIRHRGKLYAGETKLSVEYAMKATLDFLIPEIAISMAEQNSFFITRQEILTVMRRYFERVERMEEYQGWMNWCYIYDQNIKAIIHEIKRIDRGRKIPEYACKNLGIMRETANGRYFFVHQYFRDYFAACALINRILGAIEEREYIRDTMDVSSEEFASYVYPLHDLEMSDYICALVGEILGERKNIPVYDSQNKRNVIAIEINEILNYKGPRIWQKPDDKKKNIVWKTKYSMERDQKKAILMCMGKERKRVASVDGDKQIIGITEKGVLYTVEREEEKADLKLFWPGQEELIHFDKLFDVTFSESAGMKENCG